MAVSTRQALLQALSAAGGSYVSGQQLAETLGLRRLTAYSRARGEKTLKERLAGEIMDAANNLGGAVKKREDTHKMAESNKAFAHYRW